MCKCIVKDSCKDVIVGNIYTYMLEIELELADIAVDIRMLELIPVKPQ